MEIQISKTISQKGKLFFGHQTMVPESAIEFIPRCGTMKTSIEVMETARTNHSVLTFQRDAPADRLAPSVASLDLLNKATGLIYQSIRPMSSELHGFLIRKRRKDCLRIFWLDLPQA